MMKKQVSERALMLRVNRSLPEGQMLKKTRRNSPDINDLGAYYIVDGATNAITAAHIDLVNLGKELGVLKAYEVLAGR